MGTTHSPSSGRTIKIPAWAVASAMRGRKMRVYRVRDGGLETVNVEVTGEMQDGQIVGAVLEED